MKGKKYNGRPASGFLSGEKEGRSRNRAGEKEKNLVHLEPAGPPKGAELAVGGKRPNTCRISSGEGGLKGQCFFRWLRRSEPKGPKPPPKKEKRAIVLSHGEKSSRVLEIWWEGRCTVGNIGKKKSVLYRKKRTGTGGGQGCCHSLKKGPFYQRRDTLPRR